MKGEADLIRGWLQKGHSDVVAMAASREAGARDACCFHAQQAAEKFLKAYLIHAGSDVPFTHNLPKLAGLAAESDAAFKGLLAQAELLTPYAVELRYDHEFWPSEVVAKDA